MNDSPDQAPPPSETAAVPTPASGSVLHSWRNPWLILALLAMGIAVWQWFETRIRLAETQQQVAQRLAESDALAKETRVIVKETQKQVIALQGKFGELEAKLAESQDQQETLEKLYRDLAGNREEWVLAEIEQGVTLAAQQLQLAANVQGAVLALQSAEVRLAGSNNPQFVALHKVILRDLDRLRALPQIDVAGMNGRLESVIAVVDSLPLTINGRPREESKPRELSDPSAPNTAPVVSLAFWQRVAADFWHEVRSLVRIQRFDREEPALLSPGQAFFLRENLKLRLLNARLALLAHDQWTFRSELKLAQFWVDRYFDNREASVLTARESLNQLSATEISIELPSLNASLSAIQNIKLVKESR